MGTNRKRLIELRKRYKESLCKFGKRLALIMGRKHPFCKSYITKLEKGDKPVTEDIVDAIDSMEKLPDNGLYVQVKVKMPHGWATPDFCLAQPVKCAGSDCPKYFIPAGKAKYCSAECRRSARRASQALRQFKKTKSAAAE